MRTLFFIALTAAAQIADAKPVLTYFPIAGRGELARLYAAVGEVDIVDSTLTTDYKTKTPVRGRHTPPSTFALV